MKKNNIISTLKAHRAELEQAGIAHLFLFGSVARDDATEASDVDLFFDQTPDIPMGYIAMFGIENRLSKLLSCKVDLVPSDAFKPHVEQNARRDAVQVF